MGGYEQAEHHSAEAQQIIQIEAFWIGVVFLPRTRHTAFDRGCLIDENVVCHACARGNIHFRKCGRSIYRAAFQNIRKDTGAADVKVRFLFENEDFEQIGAVILCPPAFPGCNDLVLHDR